MSIIQPQIPADMSIKLTGMKQRIRKDARTDMSKGIITEPNIGTDIRTGMDIHTDITGIAIMDTDIHTAMRATGKDSQSHSLLQAALWCSNFSADC